ncbi:MAG: prolyl-tRNA synthetase associated domain-containing protein [Candidatus Eremiobacterota bacterium]
MCYKILEKLNINYETISHPPVYTCEEADNYHNNPDVARSKNLFLRNKGGSRHYLVIIEGSKKVNLKELASLLDEKKLTFASPETLLKYLNVTAGAVGPFGLIYDADREVTVVLDEDFSKYQKVGFHPNVNTATLVISSDDFRKYLEFTGHRVVSLNFR